MRFFRIVSFICTFPYIILGTTFAADVESCEIDPVKREDKVTIYCKSGDSHFAIDNESDDKVTFSESFDLKFSKTLFASKRVVSIKDDATKQKVLTIEVAPGQAKIKSKVEGKTWIFHGLEFARLTHLSVKTVGTLVIQDSMELEEQLELESDYLYLLKPFSIHRGSFKLKYQEGFVSQLNFPFHSRIEDNTYSICESLSPVNSPSKRLMRLKSVPNTTVIVPIADILSAYESACDKKLNPSFQKMTEKEQRAYMQQYIFPKIRDNKMKGAIGEKLYRMYMERKPRSFEFKDPKIGVNSFDAVHIERKNQDQSDSSLKQIFISEVKYAVNGSPHLGVIKLEGKDWRQLSLPYVNSKLDKMLRHEGESKQIAQQIKNHADLVKLQLAVFNPKNCELIIYHVGTMESSYLD